MYLPKISYNSGKAAAEYISGILQSTPADTDSFPYYFDKCCRSAANSGIHFVKMGENYQEGFTQGCLKAWKALRHT